MGTDLGVSPKAELVDENIKAGITLDFGPNGVIGMGFTLHLKTKEDKMD